LAAFAHRYENTKHHSVSVAGWLLHGRRAAGGVKSQKSKNEKRETSKASPLAKGECTTPLARGGVSGDSFAERIVAGCGAAMEWPQIAVGQFEFLGFCGFQNSLKAWPRR